MTEARKCRMGFLSFFTVISLVWFTLTAWANPAQIKAYKAAFPDEKPKCINCHALEKPKKEDGQHDLNDYGQKAKKLKDTPDEDTYKAIGPIPS